MALERRCAHEAPPEDRRRGRTDFLAGRVRLEHSDAGGAVATVASNGRSYEVRLDWGEAVERQAVGVSCECARFREYTVCRHIWASLLTVDRELGDPVPGRSEIDLDLDVPETEWLEQLDVPIPATVESTTHPLWRRKLAVVGAALGESVESEPATEEESSRRREIWYRLNVYQSMERGRLVIDLYQREERQDGSLGKIKPLALGENEIEQLDDPDDHHLLHLFFATSGAASLDTRGRLAAGSIPGILYDSVVARLCATGRFAPGDGDGIGEIFAWDDGAPWRFVLRLAPCEDIAKTLQLTGVLERPTAEAEGGVARRSLAEPLVLLSDGLVIFPGSLARLDAGEDFPWMAVLRSEGRLLVPASEVESFLAQLEGLRGLPRLDAESTLQDLFRLGVPSPCLMVRLGGRARLSAEVRFAYGEVVVGRDEGRSGVLERGDEGGKNGDGRDGVGGGRLVLRDRDAEQALVERLVELGWRSRGRRSGRVEIRPSRFADAVRELIDEGWAVEAEGRRVQPAGGLQLRLRSDIDWFELDGEAVFGNVRVDLPELLRAIRAGERMVRLDDGSQGLLPEEWLEQYGPLAQLTADGDNIRFLPSQALLLDALLAETVIERDPELGRLKERLETFEGIAPATEPKGFKGTLRRYQREGLGWLSFLAEMSFGGCLADDMGLGKTVQVLALLAERGVAVTGRPSLVVSPRSVLDNWLAEARRFTPGLRALAYHGTDRSRLQGSLAEHDLVITTYGTLRRDITLLKGIPFDYVILDEAQAIKNPSSQSAKSSRLLEASHRLALTGTPVENHLGELWSLFEFLNPGMLGRLPELAEAAQSQRPDEDTLRLVARALRPFLLRRTKEEVLPDLPEKTEQTLTCELGTKQRKLYDELRDHYRVSLLHGLDEAGLRKARLQVLEALLRLRQAACHPGLIDVERSDEPSAKLETLLEQLEEVLDEGHKVLVFSQFVSLLKIVRQRLDERGVTYEYLDGRTRSRQPRIDRFQEDPDCHVFLISLRAGGLGLNLTAADYVYILDPWWNPAVEAQAIDRAHRIGQTRPVFAYRLIAADTVEEKILALQDKKRELADAILTADGGPLRDLTLDDLRLLLS